MQWFPRVRLQKRFFGRKMEANLASFRVNPLPVSCEHLRSGRLALRCSHIVQFRPRIADLRQAGGRLRFLLCPGNERITDKSARCLAQLPGARPVLTVKEPILSLTKNTQTARIASIYQTLRGACALSYAFCHRVYRRQ